MVRVPQAGGGRDGLYRPGLAPRPRSTLHRRGHRGAPSAGDPAYPVRRMGGRSADERREELAALYRKLSADDHQCPLAATRTRVVFGSGNADADLMLVGEAPGFHEDRQGKPFVGQAGKLLDKLLGEIGLDREDIFIANVLKCRPPDNRDPKPEEIAECEPHLFRQVELIEPRIICTLGNFATKLLTGKPEGITKVHGRPQTRQLGRHTVRLYPLFHPAAALYTPAMLETLREDFGRLPELLKELGPPEPTDDEADPVEDAQAAGVAQSGGAAKGERGGGRGAPKDEGAAGPRDDDATQLGLFG